MTNREEFEKWARSVFYLDPAKPLPDSQVMRYCRSAFDKAWLSRGEQDALLVDAGWILPCLDLDADGHYGHPVTVNAEAIAAEIRGMQ